MCLRNLKKPETVERIKKTLPEAFYVWKIVSWSEATTEYHSNNEPLLIKNKTYKAGNFPSRRRRLTYTPGFHAFFSRKSARRYGGFGPIKKFRVKREWLTQIGKVTRDGYVFTKCGVFSHIEAI